VAHHPPHDLALEWITQGRPRPGTEAELGRALARVHSAGAACFGADCFVAYAETSPLAPGWEARVPLHQLAPLVAHAVKFGGPYGAATARALDDILTPS
jgi:fructosamine-3-kinase